MEKVLARKGGAVKITETEFQDRHYIDIRYHYESKDGGELLPTKKGVMLTYKEFMQLAKFAKECRNDEDFMERYEEYKSEVGGAS
jgi:hypothetical protein